MRARTKHRDKTADHSEVVLRWLVITLALVLLIGAMACVGEQEIVADAVSGMAPERPAAILASSEAAMAPSDGAMSVAPGASGGETAEDAVEYGGGGATPDPETQYRTGVEALQAGDLDTAEASLSGFVARFPSNVQGRINLARVLIEKGRIVAAVEHARAAEALDPGSVVAKRTLARARAEAGDCASALALYERALEIDPEDHWSLNNMGYLLVEHGRHEDAVGPLALAVQLDAGNATFRNNLGAALEGAGYPVTAFREFQIAKGLDPNHAKASANLERLRPLVEDEAVPEVDAGIIASEFREQLTGTRRGREQVCRSW